MTEPRRSETAYAGPRCPSCGGTMWDNTTSKRNPRAPDFNCRDRSCSGVIWHYKSPEHHPASTPAPRAGRPEPIGPVVARVLGSIGADADVASGQSDTSARASQSPSRGRPSGSPPRPPGQFSSHQRTRALYRASVRYVGRRIVPLCATFGVSISADAFAAMVATVFIAVHGEEAHQRAGERRGRADA